MELGSPLVVLLVALGERISRILKMSKLDQMMRKFEDCCLTINGQEGPQIGQLI
jgi:hypothetical protein